MLIKQKYQHSIVNGINKNVKIISNKVVKNWKLLTQINCNNVMNYLDITFGFPLIQYDFYKHPKVYTVKNDQGFYHLHVDNISNKLKIVWYMCFKCKGTNYCDKTDIDSCSFRIKYFIVIMNI